MTPTIYNNNGQFILFDGTVVYIVDVQYSEVNTGYWETAYTSITHPYEQDATVTLGPHKWMRVKHAGSTIWQEPWRINAEDGDTPEFQVSGDYLQWKLSEESSWTNLVALSAITGPQGETGTPGSGIEVDVAGALDQRGECVLASTCACNPNSVSSSSSHTLFLSIGNHVLVAADIGDGSTYWHTFDGATWYQSTDDDLGKEVLAWAATADNDTNSDASTCNYLGQVILFSATPAIYNSQGRIYSCYINSEGLRNWVELTGLTTIDGLTKMSSGDVAQYFENKVDNSTIEAYNSGVGYVDKIRVTEDGITKTQIDESSFGDGIDTSGSTIDAEPSDFTGFGLRTYTSTADSEDDQQVFVDDFISDGLASEDASVSQVDGEDRNLIRVEVDDIISPTTGVDFTGLETSTDRGVVESDGYDNIYIKDADCLESDVDGLNVKADELTINADGLSELNVALTDSNTLGIQAKHLHSNTANENKGLQKGGTTTEALEVKVDTSTIGFDGTGNLEVPINGITGDRLNDNTCDNTKGAEVISDKIVVKVDDTTVEFNGSGQLQVIESYIQGLIDAGVATLNVSGQSDMVGDITFAVTNSDSKISLAVTGSGATDGTITFTTDVDDTALTTFINNVISASVTNETTYQKLKNILVAGSGISLVNNDVASTITIAATASPPSAGSIETLDGPKADGVSSDYARADHKHDVADSALTIAKTTGLQTALDARVDLNTWYGPAGSQVMVSDGTGSETALGWLIKSAGGNVFRLSITDLGDIDAVQV